MITTISHALALATLVGLGGWLTPVEAQKDACAILTDAEAAKHMVRGRTTYIHGADELAIMGGSVCQYQGGQISLWNPPDAQEKFEKFVKSWKVEKTPRQPLAGVGDRAWIMYPVPENKYQHRAAYVIAHVGDRVVTAALFARDGHANSMVGEICRGNADKLKPKEREECKQLLAETVETQESLGPAVTELAKLAVAKVRSGGSP